MTVDDTPVLVIRSIAGKFSALGLFSSAGEYVGEIAATEYRPLHGERPTAIHITVDVNPRRVVTLEPFSKARQG